MTAGGVGLVLLLAPLLGLVVNSPWSSLLHRLGDSGVLTALWLSLRTATITVVICLLVGVPLAWLLARTEFPGRRIVRALVTVPLVMPPVVGGVALLTAFGRFGLLGKPLYQGFGLQIPFTTTAVVLAQTFVAMPFLVIAVEGALRSTDERYDEVAASLGAGRGATFLRVTVPLAAPGIASGAVLAWARALGEFGATITFAGNFAGTTQTMPLLIYTTLNTDPVSAYALSLVLLALSIAVLVALRERWLYGMVR
ncbi:MAG: ABC transporter permease [Nocardioidaceae bacterium]